MTAWNELVCCQVSPPTSGGSQKVAVAITPVRLFRECEGRSSFRGFHSKACMYRYLAPNQVAFQLATLPQSSLQTWPCVVPAIWSHQDDTSLPRFTNIPRRGFSKFLTTPTSCCCCCYCCALLPDFGPEDLWRDTPLCMAQFRRLFGAHRKAVQNDRDEMRVCEVRGLRARGGCCPFRPRA